MFAGVHRIHIDLHQFPIRIAEQGSRRSGEILQPCADADDQVGFRRRCIGRGRSGHSDRAHIERIFPMQCTFAGLRFGAWDTDRVNKRC